jgi:hypothetical protein
VDECLYHGVRVRKADSPKGATQEMAAQEGEEESNRNGTYKEGILGLKSDMA